MLKLLNFLKFCLLPIPKMLILFQVLNEQYYKALNVLKKSFEDVIYKQQNLQGSVKHVGLPDLELHSLCEAEILVALDKSGAIGSELYPC